MPFTSKNRFYGGVSYNRDSSHLPSGLRILPVNLSDGVSLALFTRGSPSGCHTGLRLQLLLPVLRLHQSEPKPSPLHSPTPRLSHGGNCCSGSAVLWRKSLPSRCSGAEAGRSVAARCPVKAEEADGQTQGTIFSAAGAS